MKKLFLMLLMIGAAFAANAQSTRQVRGAVVDKKNGNPLPGAKVEATGGAESTVTDADGTFTLEVSQWLKSLTATYPGMNKKKEEIDGTNILFELTPKQKMTWFVNLVGNFTLCGETHPELSTPGMGLMFGQLGKWGWYGKFMCDFHGPVTYSRTNYRINDSNGAAGYFYWVKDGEKADVYYDEKEENLGPGPTITFGGIKSIIPNTLYGYLGAGYTTGYGDKYDYKDYSATFTDAAGISQHATYSYSVNYRGYSTEYRHNITDPGIAFDGGFIFRVKHFDVMLGYTLRLGFDEGECSHTFGLGAGYVF